jgi:hypothetical protein
LRLVNQSFIAWERFVGRINVRQEWRRGVWPGNFALLSDALLYSFTYYNVFILGTVFLR